MSFLPWRASVAPSRSPRRSTENKAANGAGTRSGENGHQSPSVSAVQARANIERDARKASSAGNGRQVPVERVLEQPETRVSEEGTNLLEERKA